MTKENLGKLIIDSEDTMYRVARSILSCDADCADAIQEAIVKAFSKYSTMRNDRFAKTWLIRIVINECYLVNRKGGKTISLDAYQEEFPESSSPERGNYSDLYEAIQNLPSKMRLVVLLYYIEGYHTKEIARMIDGTESAVKNRLLKARVQLKELLREGE